VLRERRLTEKMAVQGLSVGTAQSRAAVVTATANKKRT